MRTKIKPVPITKVVPDHGNHFETTKTQNKTGSRGWELVYSRFYINLTPKNIHHTKVVPTVPTVPEPLVNQFPFPTSYVGTRELHSGTAINAMEKKTQWTQKN